MCFAARAASRPRQAARSEKEPDAAEYRIRIGAARILVLHLLVGRLEHNFRRRKDREARRVKLRAAGARGLVGVGPGKPVGLQILVGVAIERNRLPFATEDGTELVVIGDLT